MITEHNVGYVDLNVMIKVSVYDYVKCIFCVYLSFTFWMRSKINPLENIN